MPAYELKERGLHEYIRNWPSESYAPGVSATYPSRRSTKDIVPDSRVILETNDDVRLCVVVEQNNEGTKFTGRVIEVYPPGTLTVRGSGKDADQPIDFTDRNIFTVQHLA